MLTLKYIEENPEVTDAGYNLSEEMCRFVDKAAEADYTTDDGTDLELAIDEFWTDAHKFPDKVKDHIGREKCGTIREVVFTLYAPKAYIDEWRRRDLRQLLASNMTKDEIVETLEHFGTAVNEYFRLLWIVAEHGGWQKPATNNQGGQQQ